MPKKLLFPLFVFLCTITVFGQNYTKKWNKVVALESQGRVKTALKRVNRIYKKAKRKGDNQQLVKTFFFRSRYLQILKEDAQKEIISNIQKDISSINEPEKSILEYIYAACLSQYWKKNSYKINRRSSVDSLNASNQIEKWTADDFWNVIDSLSVAVQDKKQLQNRALRDFKLLFEYSSEKELKEENLYSFLLDRYKDLLIRHIHKSYGRDKDFFKTHKEKLLGKTGDFLRVNFHKPHYGVRRRLIQIFQKIERLHRGNEDRVWQRIDFFYTYFYPHKSDYQKRLTRFQNQLTDTTVIKKVQLKRADLYDDMAHKSRHPNYKNKALAILDTILQTRVNSTPYKKAYQKKQSILQKNLRVQHQKFVYNKENTRAIVDFRNADSLFIRVYRVPAHFREKLNSASPDSLVREMVSNQEPLKTQSYQLPNKGNHFQYSTEILMPNLSTGNYLLVFDTAANTNSFSSNYSVLTVSDIALLRTHNDSITRFQFLHRKTGHPLGSIQVQVNGQSLTTSDQGTFLQKKSNVDLNQRSTYLTTINGKDTLLINYRKPYPWYRKKTTDEKRRAVIKLFLDRAIYRPGQKVYVKGIGIQQQEGEKQIIPQKTFKVVLQDPKDNTLKTWKQTTNKFGSFDFSFHLPSHGLTGNYKLKIEKPDSIQESQEAFWNKINLQYSHISFSVEEYKRPTFQVEFDSLPQDVRFDEKAEISGRAVSFSGVPIDHAEGTYKVVRKAYYQSWRHRYSSKMVIKKGDFKTDVEGHFTIDFMPTFNGEVPQKDRPVLTYRIKVHITDNRGETQQEETVFKVGYHNLVLQAIMPNRINTQSENMVKLNSTDLNGHFKPTQGKVEVYFEAKIPQKFKTPTFYKPEIPGFSLEEFETLFPHEKIDRRKTKEDADKLIHTQGFNTGKSKEVSLDFLKDEPAGRYKLRFFTVDRHGDTIQQEKSFKVLHRDLNPDQLFSVKAINKTPFEDGFVMVEIKAAIPDLVVIAIDGEADHNFHYARVKDGKTEIKIPLTAVQAPMIRIPFYAYFDNQLFKKRSLVLKRPPKKDLTIAVKTFRHKIKPGAKETWRFTIHRDKNPATAEVLASMYDSSLDQFRKTDWGGLEFPYHYPRLISGTFSVLAQSKKRLWFRHINPPQLNYQLVDHSIDLNWYHFDFTTSHPELLTQEKSNPTKNAKTVYGKITSEEGVPLPGVNITVVGTGRGTKTDFYGKYEIKVEPGKKLQFSLVGFKDQYRKIEKNEAISIIMEIEEGLQNVAVATGYTRAKTAAVTTVTVEDVSEINLLQVQRAHSPKAGDAPLFVLDGKTITREEFLKLDAKSIAKITKLSGPKATSLYGDKGKNGVIVITTQKAFHKLMQIETRKDFRETAFFYPHLYTDQAGNISFEFTAPEVLTTWKVRLLAHDKKARYGLWTDQTITQKDLMIRANMPRFLREKDQVVLKARVVNLTDQKQSGLAVLQLFDAETMNPIDTLTGNLDNIRQIQLTPNGNTEVHWKIKVPKGISGLQYKVLVKTGNKTDGEEDIIPVLTNSVLVTETQPIWIKPHEKASYTLEPLLDHSSKTKKNYRLTLEYTSNPTWLAIRALPYLMEYPFDCSEQLFARYYANAMATNILQSQPAVADYFKEIKKDSAVASSLAKNEALKSILIEETPWLRNVQSEKERKERLATLFDLAKMQTKQEKILDKLAHQQLENGGFPWFKGGKANPFITRYIVAGIGKLNRKTADKKPKLQEMVVKAIKYLDDKFENRADYQFNSHRSVYWSSSVMHYLYARSFYREEVPINDTLQQKMDQVLTSFQKNWVNASLYQKGMAAIVYHRFGNQKMAKKILKSLKETSSLNEEKGMYWVQNTNSRFWYKAPIETQAMLINAFAEVDRDKKSVDKMKVWLLKNKQLNHWSSTKSTTEAVDALLTFGKDWITTQKPPKIDWGNTKKAEEKKEENNTAQKAGYFKLSYNKDEISDDLATVKIKNKADAPGYGGLYYQYFEDADKITVSNSEDLQIEKALYHQVGERKLKKVTAENPIHLGDLITVRLMITTKENLEFVHLKDSRASGFEPKDVLSEYKYQDGIFYYQSTRDASTNFFFNRLPKGTYIIEYQVKANNIGKFSIGTAELQSMYAPEFSVHTTGGTVAIEK